MNDLAEILPEWRNLSLDEIAARLAAMPKEARDEIVGAAMQFTAGMKWLPAAGPQQQAYFSEADLLLYGGSGGSGKSDLLIGLAFTAHKKSLIMRQQFNDLDALTERAIEINGTKAGFNGSPPPSLRTTDGRFIQFTGAALEKWQGQPFDLKCVTGDTQVRMAFGPDRPIAALTPGDLVATLDGPRRVVRVVRPRLDDAVWAVAYGASGKILGSQCQGLSHRLLAIRGWASFADALSRSAIPTENYNEHTIGSLSLGRNQLLGRHHKSNNADLPPFLIYAAKFLGRQFLPETSVSYAQSGGAIGSELSYGLFQAFLRLLLSSLSARALPALSFQGFLRSALWLTGAANAGCGALISSKFLSFPDHYSSGNHPYGGRVPRSLDHCSVAVDGLICPRQQGDAGQPSPNCFEADAQGKIPRYNLHRRTYDHPYRSETRQAVLATEACSIVMLPAGKRWLYDLEIEDANHYVTGVGFVNQNCFDEGAQMDPKVIKFHLGWIRSSDPKQRTRAVIATNPPVNSQGDWIIGMFRPWLDLTYERPAKHGELRWYVKDPDGNDFEVPDRTPYQFPGQTDVLIPQSRTFIPGKLKDNPYLARTNYQATLDSLEEPLRSAIRDGNFMASRADQEYQVIPTAWILAAQKRWKETKRPDYQMTAIAADVGQGGVDRVVLAPRYGEYYDNLVVRSGKDCKNGTEQAALIVLHRRDGAGVVVDVGGGYGGDCCGRLEDNGIHPTRFDGSAGSTARTKDGSKRIFDNKRAEAWWRFREALDPDQPGGSIICLPDDPELRSELSSVRFIPDVARILIEPKKEVKKRLGRSPDKADAVVMAWSPGDVAVKRNRFGSGNSAGNYERNNRANIGFASLKDGFNR